MKLSLSLILLAVTSAMATEELEERGTPMKCDKYAHMIPQCARPGIKYCTMKAGCKYGDWACGCKKSTLRKIQKCSVKRVGSKCNYSQLEAAAKAGHKICKCAG